MNYRLSALLFVLLGALLLWQAHRVLAQTSTSQPVTSPITSPISSPLTQPITTPISAPISAPISQPITAPLPTPITRPILPIPTPIPLPRPITYYHLTGNVVYRIFQWVIPAASVNVEVVNTQNGERYFTRTDFNGVYDLKVKPGQYRVRVFDFRQTLFKPAYQIVTVNNNTNKISFEGVIFPPKIERTFTLSGNITYINNYWRYNYGRRIMPEAAVEAINTRTNERVMVNADKSGRFNLTVKEGYYRIRVYDKMGSYYMPAVQYIQVNNNITNLSFWGFLRFW